jgi:hypothetical protein
LKIGFIGAQKSFSTLHRLASLSGKSGTENGDSARFFRKNRELSLIFRPIFRNGRFTATAGCPKNL